MKKQALLIIGAVCVMVLMPVVPLVGYQVWVFTRTYEDEPAIEKLKEWRVDYSRHPVDSPIAYWGGNVSVVTFTGEVDREMMGLLLSLKQPDTVGFVRCQFTEKGLLLRTAEIGTLKQVTLWHDVVTDDDLIELLPRLKTVEWLHLQDNPITDRCVDAIASMPRLRAVCLAGTKVSRAGKARLRSLRPKLDVDDAFQPPF
jgi:hypothetical protein